MKNPLKRIGLFGGTFDPVHIGHMVVAEWLTEILQIDTTFWIPAYGHPFDKRVDISNADKRLEMVQRAIDGYPKFQVSTFELDKKGVSYAIDTIAHFIKAYPDSEFYYFIGQDNLKDFLKWRDPLRILEKSYLAVFNRISPIETEKNDLEEHPKVLLVESPRIDISSSHIRRRIEKGMAWKSLVPERVYAYIKANNLYNRES